jgi:hypothetical protein
MITEQQWSLIEREMQHILGSFELKCDGYEITAKWMCANRKTMKYNIAVYVNGWFKGEWFKPQMKDEPFEAKFYPVRSKFLYPAKSSKHWKSLSKREQKMLRETLQNEYDPYAKFKYRDVSFRNFKELKKHLKSVCSEIEILKIGSNDYIVMADADENA